MITVQEKIEANGKELKNAFHIKNDMILPRLEKVVISVGTGSIVDKKKRELIEDRLSKIAGQKVSVRQAKKSIANFKLREGQPIGLAVTLRGKDMYSFLDRFINVAIPRMRDFQGIDPSNVDSMGNITVGIKEHSIFPETSEEDLKDIFGLSVTIVTSATERALATAFLRGVGLPIKKDSVESE